MRSIVERVRAGDIGIMLINVYTCEVGDRGCIIVGHFTVESFCASFVFGGSDTFFIATQVLKHGIERK